jgi:hypothetical protein
MKRVKNHQLGNVMVLGNKKPTWNSGAGPGIPEYGGSDLGICG